MFPIFFSKNFLSFFISDAALNDQSLMNGQEHTTDLGNMDAPYPGLDDDSFDTKILPAYGLDQSDGLENDPIPLGDEVSMGVISRNESENYNNPTPISMPNTNRQTGTCIKISYQFTAKKCEIFLMKYFLLLEY